MFRKLELLAYLVVIAFFIVRYANVDVDTDRRGASPGPGLPIRSAPYDPSIFLPDGAALPRDGNKPVLVELDPHAHNGVGTAFAVDGNGTFVTARHVIDGCARVYLVHGRGLEPVVSVVSERNRDFAVIKAAEQNEFHLTLSEEALSRGTEGFMMGYPQGDPADVRATVIGRTEMRSSGRYRMREPVITWVERERRPSFAGSLGGISGGPVFDGDGNVVGTVVAGAPRRGRVYTTHPQVFDDTGLMDASRIGRTPTLDDGITARNYHRIGKAFRASGAIKQIYCKVS